MRYLVTAILVLAAVIGLRSQTIMEIQEGKVSYVTSQSVYVKFSSTEKIAAGDTLYIKQDDEWVPALEVKNLSSISCVCVPILTSGFKEGNTVFSRKMSAPTEGPDTLLAVPAAIPAAEGTDSLAVTVPEEEPLKQEISGRVSVASYSNFSNSGAPNTQRMRYTFSFNGYHLGDSKFSVESYISYVHSNAKGNEIKENPFSGLKVYNLALNYDFNKTTRLWLGRKINPTISNVGAIDGLQFEKKFGAFNVGAFAGSRPDYTDYGFDFSLLQYGAYFGHKYTNAKGQLQSSIAFAEQNNNGNTDRRFLYFQHSNSLVRNLYFFGTVEVDLYKKVDNTPESTFDLTNLYLSLRYKIIKQLSLSASYSARNNIILYETYKNIIDRLLETETLQGWRLQLNYRPIKFMSIGVTGSYRYRKPDPKPSRSLYSYVTFSRIPGLNAAITLSATILETSYLNGNIYSLGLTRDLVPGKLSGGFNYRMVDYKFQNSEMDLPQHIGDVNLHWRIYKKLSLSLNYEGTFEKEKTYNRVYVNLSQRF